MPEPAATSQTVESDEALLERFYTLGDEAAFGELVERHRAFVYRLAFARCGRQALTEEITQEVFMQLVRKTPRKPDLAFRLWLYGLVSNAARVLTRSEARSAKRAQSRRYLERANALPNREMQAEQDEECRAELLKALSAMKEEHRVPVVLHYIQGLTQADVGALVGLSQSMVARRISQGLELLRSHMARAGFTAGAVALPQLLGHGQFLAPSEALNALLASPSALKAAAGNLRLAQQASVRLLAARSPWIARMALALAVAVPLAVAGWSVLGSGAGTAAERPAPQATQAPEPPRAEAPLNFVWDFEDGDFADVLPRHGRFLWGKSEQTGRHILAFPPLEEEGFLKLPIKPEGRTLMIEAEHKGYNTGNSLAGVILCKDDLPLPCEWYGPAKRMGIDLRTFRISRFYLLEGRYMVATRNEGVWGFWEYAKPVPDAQLVFCMMNIALGRLTVKSIAPEEVPPQFRDMQAVRMGLVSMPREGTPYRMEFKTAVAERRKH